MWKKKMEIKNICEYTWKYLAILNSKKYIKKETKDEGWEKPFK
ncbi:hypothetical protein [Mycoplasma sp. 654]